MDKVNSNDLCRLCLSNNAIYDIFEEKIHVKIISLLHVEVSMEDNLPGQICRQCRLQLEKFYVFRSKSADSDRYLRQNLPQEDLVEESLKWMKRHDNDFNEHDYEPQPKKLKSESELSEVDVDAIEKTVQTALQKNGYNGRFVLKVEDIDDSGLRKVRVIKDNGSVILMKLKMPERATSAKKMPVVAEELQIVLKKCEKIESIQDKLLRTTNASYRLVQSINERMQVAPVLEYGQEMNNIGQDDDAPFYFPITHLGELWRLNNKLGDAEVKAQLTEEMNKVEAQMGTKISGKIFRTVISKTLLSQICWSGRIKDGQKYVKSEDKVMLSKMHFLVDWLYSLVSAKEPDTSLNTFLQTIMNIMRKERFKSTKDTENYYGEAEEEYETVEQIEEFVNDGSA